MSRPALQVVTAVLAIVPVVTGVIGLRGINDPLYAPVTTPRALLLDTNLRFFSGVWLGMGLALPWLIPPASYIFFILLELVGAPSFIWWQHRVAQAASSLSG